MYTEVTIKNSFMRVLYNEMYDHSKSIHPSQNVVSREIGPGGKPGYRVTKTAV